MLNYCLKGICEISSTLLPIKMSPGVDYLDMVTFLFCVILTLLTLLVVLNRRKFGYILHALFAPRDRSQLLRETKVFGEWIYVSTLTYNFLIQGMLLLVIAQFFLPNIAGSIGNFALYFLSIACVVADYFLKMMFVSFLCHIFECNEDKNHFNLSKFFYQTVNSVALFPILAAVVYTQVPQLLLLYVPVFLTSYITMLYRTLTLNSAKIKPFQFFLYFCTLEILPYLVILKVLVSI